MLRKVFLGFILGAPLTFYLCGRYPFRDTKHSCDAYNSSIVRSAALDPDPRLLCRPQIRIWLCCLV